MKKLLLFLLALPMLSAAQEPPVQVPYTCGAGNAFTIRIPVRFPADMTMQYEWYKDDMAIAGTFNTLAASAGKIAYTIPAYDAYGSAMYHFKYCLLYDGCDAWANSPRYIVSFCPAVTSPGSASVAAYSCSGGISGAGTVSVTAYSCSGGVSSAGTVSVAAYSCSGGISNAGTISIAVTN